MAGKRFFVVARVVGRENAFDLWCERLEHLCGVSATERYGDSYYWGQDLDGEPNTLWGLEGYSHPIGFFIGHISTEIFKTQMALVDKDELLRTRQGLDSPDYDLKHYDEEAGWLKRADDADRDSKTSHVAVYHFWAVSEAQRLAAMGLLAAFSEEARVIPSVQSSLVLRELKDEKLCTLWLRVRSEDDFKLLQESSALITLLGKLAPITDRKELHQSRSVNGHLALKE